jgi:hypothetical protein
MEVDADPVTVTPPAGWTLLLDTAAAQGTGSAFHAQVWYRVAAASEPASYSWTVPSGTWVDIALLDYSGVNTASPIDAAAGRYAGVGTSAGTPSVTTTQANDLVVAAFIDYNACSWTPAAGTTERYDFDGNSGDDFVQASAGSVSKTATASTSGALSAQIIAIRGR